MNCTRVGLKYLSGSFILLSVSRFPYFKSMAIFGSWKENEVAGFVAFSQ